MNAEQLAYLRSLSYAHTGDLAALDALRLTDEARAGLREVTTVGDLVEFIKNSNHFGLKDSFMLRLLG